MSILFHWFPLLYTLCHIIKELLISWAGVQSVNERFTGRRGVTRYKVIETQSSVCCESDNMGQRRSGNRNLHEIWAVQGL